MSETGRLAARSLAAGLGTGVVIIAGLVARTAIAVSRRSGGWHDVRQFLGIGTKQRWYKTWTS